MKPTIQLKRGERGSVLVETAITIPVVLLLFLNLANFGVYLFDWVTVDHAARAAAQYQIYNGVAVGFPQIPAFSGICSGVWQSDISSLSGLGTAGAGGCGWTNATVEICSNGKGVVSCVWSGTGPTPSLTVPADPEPAQHILYMAAVTYNYSPIFGGFTLPVVNVPLTIPATAIERKVVMRIMQ